MPGTAKKILVVSDDPLIKEEARDSFPTDTEVTFAGDALEAWDSMRVDVPDVVVVDIQTGNAGGFALARDMAQNNRLAKVPIFMLLQRDQDRWLAGEAGAALIRTKPIGSADLARETLALIES